MGYADSDEFLHLPGKGAFPLKDLIVKVFESLKHVLLGLLKVFVMLPTVKGVKVFSHLGLLS
jgi:hypothetical protein